MSDMIARLLPFFSLAVMALPLGAQAQTATYPVKPIRIVVATSPGGLLDIVTRLLAAKMTELAGQTVIVENRPGASNNLGTEFVARAPGDGYTALNVTLPFVANPSLFKNLPFNVERDFAAVSQLVSAPYVLVVHPSVPAKSVKELVALARARPGALNYSSGGSGTNFHMAMELFKQQTRTQMVHIPYKGGGPAFAAVMAGEADVTVPSVAAALPQVRAGRVRALAVTGAQRAALLPELPTAIEAGLPDYTFTSWLGMVVPASTPPATIAALNGYVVKAMRSNDIVQKLAADGTDVVAGTPEQLRALIKSELSRWAAVIKAAGLKVE